MKRFALLGLVSAVVAAVGLAGGFVSDTNAAAAQPAATGFDNRPGHFFFNETTVRWEPSPYGQYKATANAGDTLSYHCTKIGSDGRSWDFLNITSGNGIDVGGWVPTEFVSWPGLPLSCNF